MIKALLTSCVNFLLPRTSEEMSAQLLTEDTLMLKALQQTVVGCENATAFFKYKDPLIKKALWDLKYHHKKNVAELFACAMYPYILDDISSKILFGDIGQPIVVPIPVTQKRKRERGYNQAECIAEALVNEDGARSISLCSNVLMKNKNTEHQARVKNKVKRLENIRNTFDIKNSENIKGKDIILIDDIVTTGATITEARRTLLAAGARSVTTYVVAH